MTENEKSIEQIYAYLDVFAKGLPLEFDARKISCRSRLIPKLFIITHSMRWRTEELGRIACDHFASNKFVPGAIMTRSLYENVSVLFSLSSKLKIYDEEFDAAKLHKDLQQILFGGRFVSEMPESTNILTLVKKVNKRWDGFLDAYEFLCEFAHPNYLGTAGSYAIAENESVFRFGKSITAKGSEYEKALSMLRTGLFEYGCIHDEITAVLPTLAQKCDAVFDVGD